MYEKLIINKENLFPDLTTIANELWIIILLFIYQILNNIKLRTEETVKRKETYIRKTMSELQRKYNVIIDNMIENDQLKGLVYSILIIENFNRPKIVRWLEYLCFFITKKPHTLGVMQYNSDKYINNEQSIILGIEKIKNGYAKLIEGYEIDLDKYFSEWSFKSEIANIYNTGSDYSNDICAMWEKIMEIYYSKTTDTLYKRKNASH